MIKYKVLFSEKYNKSFSKLDHYTQKMITNWIEKHLEGCSNPRSFGKALKHELKGLWRYRVGDYRLICELIDKKLIILALAIGHRRDIYK